MKLATSRNPLLPVGVGGRLPTVHVWKRADSQFWRYRIRLGSQTIDQGATRCTNEVAAQAMAHQRLIELTSAIHAGVAAVPLAKALATFYALKVEPDEHKTAHSKRTYKSELGIILRYFAEALGETCLVSALTPAAISAFKVWLVRPIAQADGTTKAARKGSSANRLLGLLHSVLVLAKTDMNAVAEVPGITLFEEAPSAYAVVDYREEERLIRCANPELRDLFITAADTSLRRCELLRLTWPMVVWSPDERVRRTYIAVPAHIRKWKRGQPLRIPLSDRVLPVFTRRLAAAADREGKIFAYSVDDGQMPGPKPARAKGVYGRKRTSTMPGAPVLGAYAAPRGGYYVQIDVGGKKPERLGWAATWEDARALRLAAEHAHWGPPDATIGFQAAWKKARRDAGIRKRIRWHDLRHTAATRLLNAGVHPKHVQGMLGHADIETTMRYLHTAEGYEDQAVALAEAARRAALGLPAAPATVAVPPPAQPDDSELFVVAGDGVRAAARA